jgi:hypothetical protein
MACSVVFSAEPMELADESMEISACTDDFSRRSMELARHIDVFGPCSDVFAHLLHRENASHGYASA